MADDPTAPPPPPGEEGHREPPHPQPRFLDFLALGTSCAMSIIVAGGLGYLLDDWLGTTPWLTFVGLAFGITSAVMLAIVRLRPYL
jgi:hypothetical protein